MSTIVRTLTVATAGLASPTAPLGIHLFVGPNGTGKTHLARSVAKLVHGDPRKLVVLDCIQLAGRDDWSAVGRQLAPHFRYKTGDGEEAALSMGTLSVLLIEHLEWARPDTVQAIVGSLETGSIVLPDGKCGSLAGCLVLMTSNLCAREIFDAGRPEIGFSPAREIEETEKARVYQLVATAAEKQWGGDFLSHLDDLLVFHRLREAHLPYILMLLVLEINEQLAAREICCELDAGAAAFLLARAARFPRQGAWILVRVFRRFVLFPIADLVHSDRIAKGSKLLVSAEDERLRFDVRPGRGRKVHTVAELEQSFEVPVAWAEASS